MKTEKLFGASAAVLLCGVGLVLAACSSSSSTTSASSAKADAASTSADNSAAADDNCVAKTSKGNDKGVGAYCDPNTNCPKSSDPSVFLLCTSSEPSTPKDHFFCTAPCTRDDDCGNDAYCAKDGRGSGCVPFACGDRPNPGGSTDAGDGG